MASVSNVIVYKEDWTANLQARLSEPTKFKDICNLEYTNVKVLNNPYLTDPTVQTNSRGCSYTFQNVIETSESVSSWTSKILPQFIDRADLAQSGYDKQMEMSDRQAVLLNEAIEAAVYADYGNMTTFDATALGGTGSITVSSSNVDDIIRTIYQTILTASGASLLERNGAFIVWRPADFNLLQAFAQTTGFASADAALRGTTNPSIGGWDFMGFTHYTSNQLSGGHVIAGVKKVYHLGILQDTYGQIMVDDKDPAQLSGISVVSRVDFAGKVWTKVKPVLFDVRCA